MPDNNEKKLREVKEYSEIRSIPSSQADIPMPDVQPPKKESTDDE